MVIGWAGTAAAIPGQERQEGAQGGGPGSAEENISMTRHYENSLFKVTDSGEFSVEVLLPEHRVEPGMNSLDLILHDREDQDVPGAKITVVPWMPTVGHGVLEKPVVNEKGGGLYNVKNILFSTAGQWELRMEITSDGTMDTVRVPMPAIGASGKDSALKTPDTSRIDTSTEVTSSAGHYIVSYRSDAEPIPVNQVVSWDLTVEYGDDKPVRSAVIRVFGEMPVNGSALPLEPEVSGTMTDGQYHVEGLKFSMNGWWVVTFRITAGGITDQASFNLVLP